MVVVSGASFSTCEETVVSEAASSMIKFEISPLRELSSSPFTDADGDASGVVLVVLAVVAASAGDEDVSNSSTGCCRLQYMILAVRVRIIF